jgi:hypothetical protein
MTPGVPRPSIVPLSNGSLQIEWHCRGWDIEVEIAEPNWYQAWARDLSTGAEEETSPTCDLRELVRLISNISDVAE